MVTDGLGDVDEVTELVGEIETEGEIVVDTVLVCVKAGLRELDIVPELVGETELVLDAFVVADGEREAMLD